MNVKNKLSSIKNKAKGLSKVISEGAGKLKTSGIDTVNKLKSKVLKNKKVNKSKSSVSIRKKSGILESAIKFSNSKIKKVNKRKLAISNTSNTLNNSNTLNTSVKNAKTNTLTKEKKSISQKIRKLFGLDKFTAKRISLMLKGFVGEIEKIDINKYDELPDGNERYRKEYHYISEMFHKHFEEVFKLIKITSADPKDYKMKSGTFAFIFYCYCNFYKMDVHLLHSKESVKVKKKYFKENFCQNVIDSFEKAERYMKDNNIQKSRLKDKRVLASIKKLKKLKWVDPHPNNTESLELFKDVVKTFNEDFSKYIKSLKLLDEFSTDVDEKEILKLVEEDISDEIADSETGKSLEEWNNELLKNLRGTKSPFYNLSDKIMDIFSIKYDDEEKEFSMRNEAVKNIECISASWENIFEAKFPYLNEGEWKKVLDDLINGVKIQMDELKRFILKNIQRKSLDYKKLEKEIRNLEYKEKTSGLSEDETEKLNSNKKTLESLNKGLNQELEQKLAKEKTKEKTSSEESNSSEQQPTREDLEESVKSLKKNLINEINKSLDDFNKNLKNITVGNDIFEMLSKAYTKSDMNSLSIKYIPQIRKYWGEWVADWLVGIDGVMDIDLRQKIEKGDKLVNAWVGIWKDLGNADKIKNFEGLELTKYKEDKSKKKKLKIFGKDKKDESSASEFEKGEREKLVEFLNEIKPKINDISKVFGNLNVQENDLGNNQENVQENDQENNLTFVDEFAGKLKKTKKAIIEDVKKMAKNSVDIKDSLRKISSEVENCFDSLASHKDLTTYVVNNLEGVKVKDLKNWMNNLSMVTGDAICNKLKNSFAVDEFKKLWENTWKEITNPSTTLGDIAGLIEKDEITAGSNLINKDNKLKAAWNEFISVDDININSNEPVNDNEASTDLEDSTDDRTPTDSKGSIEDNSKDDKTSTDSKDNADDDSKKDANGENNSQNNNISNFEKMFIKQLNDIKIFVKNKINNITKNDLKNFLDNTVEQFKKFYNVASEGSFEEYVENNFVNENFIDFKNWVFNLSGVMEDVLCEKINGKAGDLFKNDTFDVKGFKDLWGNVWTEFTNPDPKDNDVKDWTEEKWRKAGKCLIYGDDGKNQNKRLKNTWEGFVNLT